MSKKGTKITKTSFRRAVELEGGNVSGVARRLKIARSSVYNYLQRWDMRDELDAAKADMIGAAKDTVYDQVLEGDLDAARFVLTHHPKNPERWTSRQEVTVTGVSLSAEVMQLMEELGVDVETAAEAFEAQIRRMHAEAMADG